MMVKTKIMSIEIVSKDLFPSNSTKNENDKKLDTREYQAYSKLIRVRQIVIKVVTTPLAAAQVIAIGAVTT